MKTIRAMISTLEGAQVTLRGYRMEAGNVVADSVSSAGDGPLCDCYGTVSCGRLFMRSAVIDTMEKGDDYYAISSLLMNKLGERAPKRLVAAHLALLDVEGESVSREHQELLLKDLRFGERCQIAHHPITTEKLCSIPASERMAGLSLHDFYRLERLYSAEALSWYGLWLAEDLNGVVSAFSSMATDLYELEANVMDFVHEARSHLTASIKMKIRETLPEPGQVTTSAEQMFRQEKALLGLRGELLLELEKQVPLVEEVITALNHIGDIHPEFTSLRIDLIIFLELLEEVVSSPNIKPAASWGKKLLLSTLLWNDLHVLISYSSERGLARANGAFAVSLAVTLLSEKIPARQLADLFLHWDETAIALNYAYLQGRRTPFHEPRLDNGWKLRKTISRLLYDLSLPGEGSSTEKGVVNIELLQLLFPENLEGEQLIVYSSDTALPVGLTDAGQSLLGPILN